MANMKPSPWNERKKAQASPQNKMKNRTIVNRLKSGKRFKEHILLSLVVASVVTFCASTGWLDGADFTLADTLYQNADSYNDNILVIGIDSYALDELGDWPWDRSIMADIIYSLNADPENQPAAIGVDVLYVMENDPWADAYLVEAVAEAGNVVVASGVEFTQGFVFDEDGNAYMDEFSVEAYEYPFEALSDVAAVGHVNVMYDDDGVLRHHLWSVPSEEGGETLSMAYELYAMYCEQMGLDADFSPALSSEGFWWVDYSAMPDTYYAYSAADIIYGTFDSTVLKDAIVIIGPYNAGMSDEYVTPVDHAQNMYGVEYVANVTNAMVQGVEKTEISYQLVMLFIFIYVCTMFFVNGKMKWTWLLALAMIALCMAVDMVGYHFGDIILMPMWPLVGIAFGWVVSMAEHYAVALLEQKRISNTFGHYVDPFIIKELMKEGEGALDLGGRTVDIAVLFVDIRGFTTMSEKLPPEDVVQILNEYLTLTSQSIKKTHGTLDKFVGDCTMAFWGAPLPCEDSIYCACRSAIAMVEGAKAVEERILARYGYSVTFGVGVHYGPAVVGNIGAVDRMDYTAIGDTVNTAARLEANAPSGSIYISRIVADALGNRGKMTSLGDSVPLKGKESGFEVLRLEALE